MDVQARNACVYWLIFIYTNLLELRFQIMQLTFVSNRDFDLMTLSNFQKVIAVSI